MRRLLLWSGKQLIDTKFGGIMILLLAILGVILPVVSPDALEKTFDFQSAKGLVIYVIAVIVAIFIVYLITQAIGHAFIRWGKSIRPNIEILPLDTQRESEYDGERLFTNLFASLKIINKEDFIFTNCYAVFKSGHPIVLPKESIRGHWVEDVGKKIRWKNTQECQVNIGAWTGEETLQIFMVTLGFDNSNNMNVIGARFCLCNEDQRKLFPFGVYEFEIEIHGSLDGESIKPIPYKGTFDISISSKNENSIIIPELKITELLDNKMKKQTKKQPKEKKEETFTKEEFLKALKKATRPLAPKVSRGKGKSKTSE